VGEGLMAGAKGLGWGQGRRCTTVVGGTDRPGPGPDRGASRRRRKVPPGRRRSVRSKGGAGGRGTAPSGRQVPHVPGRAVPPPRGAAAGVP